MDQNHVLQEVYRAEFLECALLVGKVVIERNGKFTEYEIETAKRLLDAPIEWNQNIIDFLDVVAGTAHAGVDVWNESYGALIHPYPENQ